MTIYSKLRKDVFERTRKISLKSQDALVVFKEIQQLELSPIRVQLNLPSATTTRFILERDFPEIPRVAKISKTKRIGNKKKFIE